MNGTATEGVGYADLLRDLRHESARAASDLADWLAYLAVDGKADRTLYSYTRELALLLREHPDKTVGEFAASDINAVLALKPERSRYITRSVFNQFFEWAVLDERIERNPMIGRVPKMRIPKRRTKDIFSREEVAILEALPSPDGQLFSPLFYTGLRRGEARGLRRDHVDLNRERLIVYHGKGDKDRIVPLPIPALKAVADLDLTERLGREDHFWYTRRGDRRLRRDPIGDTTFERWYRTRIAQAGVRYLNPHQTRHSYGQLLREEGFDIEERQVLMGHESIKTTQHYYGRMTVEDVASKMRSVSW